MLAHTYTCMHTTLTPHTHTHLTDPPHAVTGVDMIRWYSAGVDVYLLLFMLSVLKVKCLDWLLKTVKKRDEKHQGWPIAVMKW